MAKRYEARPQPASLTGGADFWYVWDTQTKAPAEAHGMRYINLRKDEAIDDAEMLNGAE
jgi:hypothetical protein